MPQWDADLYLQFASERTQPVFDLLNRIHLRQPRRIADLGCGPGNSTEALRRHWPDSSVVGVDLSAEMIRKARQDYPAGTWMIGDATTWRADPPVDLVFSNAMLQGPEGVVRWFRATGLRPFLDALDSGQERSRFEASLLKRYSTSYPRRPSGSILFPFRRLFFVAY